MKRTDANKIANAQIAEWLERNREPGALPCVPIIMISSLCGNKPGITLNLCKRMALEDVVKILKAAQEQVERTISQISGN